MASRILLSVAAWKTHVGTPDSVLGGGVTERDSSIRTRPLPVPGKIYEYYSPRRLEWGVGRKTSVKRSQLRKAAPLQVAEIHPGQTTAEDNTRNHNGNVPIPLCQSPISKHESASFVDVPCAVL